MYTHSVLTHDSFIIIICALSPTLQIASVSSSGLISEAVSFLNGAHLNPRGQLSNLFRRYHQTLSSTSTTSRGCSTQVHTPSLSSLVLSEIGVSHLNEEQLGQALSNMWTSLDSHSVGNSITVSDVLKQCRGTYTVISMFQEG